MEGEDFSGSKNEGKFEKFEDGKTTLKKFEGVLDCDKNQEMENLKRKIPEFSEPRIIIESRGENNYPEAVTSNSKGQILVCDWNNHRIKIFDQNGIFIKSFGTRGSKPGQFIYPTGITIDNQDNIYISDGRNHRIQIFNNDGSKIIKIIGRDDYENGKGNGEFDWPMGIFINPQNQDILVVDSMNHRIQIFDKYYNFVRKFGSEGNKKGELNWPIGIVMNSQNEILVSENTLNRIQVFDYSGNYLRFIDSQDDELKQPYHLCIDEMDNLYVGSEEDGFPVQIFNKDGKLVNSLKSKKNGKPMGVNLHSIDGSLMIADWKNEVVYIY